MKRYNFGTRDIYPHDNGDWVMYEEVKQLNCKLEALRNEVHAWRDWWDNCGVDLHPDNIEACSCEGVNCVANVLNARQVTDAAKALETKNER